MLDQYRLTVVFNSHRHIIDCHDESFVHGRRCSSITARQTSRLTIFTFSIPLPQGAAAAGKGLFWHSVPSLTQAAGAGVHAGVHVGCTAGLRGCQDTG